MVSVSDCDLCGGTVMEIDATQALDLSDLVDDDHNSSTGGSVRAHLRLLSQKDLYEKRYPLYDGDNVIGRGDECQIQIKSKVLSKEHACIEIHQQNHFIYDKDSRNKSRRGKVFMKPNARYELTDREKLVFGDVICIYEKVNKRRDSESDTPSLSDVISPEKAPSRGGVEGESGSSNGRVGARAAADDSVVAESDVSSDLLTGTDAPSGVAQTPGNAGTRVFIDETPNSDLRAKKDLDDSDVYVPESQFVRNNRSLDESIVPELGKQAGADDDDDSDRTTDGEGQGEPGESGGFDTDDRCSDRMPALMEPTLAEDSLYDLPDPPGTPEQRRTSPDPQLPSASTHTSTDSTQMLSLSPLKTARNPYTAGSSSPTQILTPVRPSATMPMESLVRTPTGSKLQDSTQMLTPSPHRVQRNPYKSSEPEALSDKDDEEIEKSPKFDPVLSEKRQPSRTAVASTPPSSASYHLMPSILSISPVEGSQSAIRLPPLEESEIVPDLPESEIVLDSQKSPRAATDAVASPIISRIDSKERQVKEDTSVKRSLLEKAAEKVATPEEEDLVLRLSDSLTQKSSENGDTEDIDHSDGGQTELARDNEPSKSSEKMKQGEATRKGKPEEPTGADTTKPTQGFQEATQKYDPDTDTQAYGEATQAYGGATQAYGGATQAYGGDTQAYDGATQAYGGATQAYGGATQAYGGDTQAYGGVTQSFGEATQAYGGATQAYDGSTQAYGEATQAYGGATQVYGEATQAYGEATQAYGEGTQAYGEGTQAYGGATQAYGEATQAYGGATQAYGEATQAYDGATQAYGEATQAYGGATQAYAERTPDDVEPTQKYAEPTEEVDDEATQGFDDQLEDEPEEKSVVHDDKPPASALDLEPPQLSTSTSSPDIVPLDTQSTQEPDLMDEDSNQSDDLLARVKEDLPMQEESREETSDSVPLDMPKGPDLMDEDSNKSEDLLSGVKEDLALRAESSGETRGSFPVEMPKFLEKDKKDNAPKQDEKLSSEALREVQDEEIQDKAAKEDEGDDDETDIEEEKEPEVGEVDLQTEPEKVESDVGGDKEPKKVEEPVTKLETEMMEGSPEKGPEVEGVEDKLEPEAEEQTSAAKGRKRRGKAAPKTPARGSRRRGAKANDEEKAVVEPEEQIPTKTSDVTADELVNERSCQVETSQLEDTQSHIEDNSEDSDVHKSEAAIPKAPEPEPEEKGRRGRSRKKVAEVAEEPKSSRRTRGGGSSVESVKQEPEIKEKEPTPAKGRKVRGRKAVVKEEVMEEEEVEEEVEKPTRGRSVVKDEVQEVKPGGRGKKRVLKEEEEKEQKPSRGRKSAVKEVEVTPAKRGRVSKQQQEPEETASRPRRGRQQKPEVEPSPVSEPPSRTRQSRTSRQRDTTPQNEEATPSTRGRGRKQVAESPKPTPTPSRKRGAAAASAVEDPQVGGKKSRMSVDPVEASPRRRSGVPVLLEKPKVLFTGVVDEKGNKTVEMLGGELVQSAESCSHLVTDKIRRTVKFLCCLGRGVPIVSYLWLDKCRQLKKFVDHEPYIISDTETETRYEFSLKDSINRAKENPLLSGWKIHVTKSVQPVRPDMAQIIKSAGGTPVPTFPKSPSDRLVIVSCEEDERSCRPAIEAGIPIVSSEFVLTGLLRHQIDLQQYTLFPEAAKQAAAQREKQELEAVEEKKNKRTKRRKKR